MLGSRLRDFWAEYSPSIGKLLARTHIYPNYFTVSAVFIAFLAAYFIAIHNFLLGLLFIILASLWDALDGAVAKAQKKESPFGNYLDAMVDKYVEIIFYLGFALAGYGLEAFLVVTGSLILSYAKPRTAIVVPIDNHDWPAIGERVDRLVLLIIALIVGTFLPTITILNYTFNTISSLLLLLAVVVYTGSIQRILYARRIINAGGTANMDIKKRR